MSRGRSRVRWSWLVAAALAAAGPVGAQQVRSLNEVSSSDLGAWAVDDAGTTVAVIGSIDPFGTNPDHELRLFALSGPGLGAEVPLPGRPAGDVVSITDDGSFVYFVSTADLVGTNADRGRELFRVRPDGSDLTQLTDAPAGGGEVEEARVAGGGTRALVLGTIDPLGGNGAHERHLFVLNPAAAGWVQLTTDPGAGYAGFDISDDGMRVVFSSDGDHTGANAGNIFQVFTAFSTGVGLLQRSTSTTVASLRPAISGDGQWIAVESDGIRAKQFANASPFVELTDGDSPSLPDDGSLVFFRRSVSGSPELLSIPVTGGFPTQLTSTQNAFESGPRVSGDGGTIVFDSIEVGSVADELATIDGSGANRESLVVVASPTTYVADSEPFLSADGEQIVFRSTHIGGDPAAVEIWDVFGIDADGGNLARLTSTGNAGHPALSGDGATLVFWSDRDPAGANACGLPQIFTAGSDGSGIVQRTTSEPGCNFWSDHPAIAADTGLIVYQEFDRLMALPPGGGAPYLVFDDGDGLRKHPRVSADGQWAVYNSESDFDGLNPGGTSQVFRVRTDGSLVERLTAFSGEFAAFPDISADGQRIVFYGSGDPLGTNADNNREVFLHDVSTGTTTQLTSTVIATTPIARISADGSTVWFRSEAPLAGHPGGWGLFRTVVGSGVIERVGGLADPDAPTLGESSLRDNRGLSVDADGDRAVFIGRIDATGDNADRNEALFLVDLGTPPSIRVGAGAPTLVSWDVEPSPWRYDVIRGDLAALADGGGFVDLGAVVCVEDDSPDADTAGDEDALQPQPGQVLFYLYRGNTATGPGSYGQGSGGGERLVASGGCAG